MPSALRFASAVGLLLACATPPAAQVELQNRYLVDPDTAVGLADTVATLWLGAVDDATGAFVTDVSREGVPTGSDRFMLTQSQNAYGMVRAFQLTGDVAYLDAAQGALDYMTATHWDADHGGWDDRGAGKAAFTHHFALIGLSAMVEATQDADAWEWLLRAYAANDANLWDDREAYLGYFESANDDWSNARGKAFSSTIDAITSHALTLDLLSDDPAYRQRLLHLADNAVDHFVGSMDGRSFGFTESFSSEWAPPSRDTFAFTGHFLKVAWCLARIYQLEPDPRYLAAVERVMDDVLAQRTAYDAMMGQWWEYEDAFSAGVTAYHLTGEEAYLRYADERLDTLFDTLWDPVYGGFYHTVGDRRKGSYYKTSYHPLEMAYSLYLYGTLFLHDQPASLYYRFEPSDAPREVSLTPLAVPDDGLRIAAVTLDEQAFTAFDPDSRTLSLAAGEGGVFRVTFEGTGGGVSREAAPEPAFSLGPNRPNPLSASTTIGYTLDRAGHVVLEMFDVLGERVAVVLDERQSAGAHDVSVAAGRLAAGVYVYRLSVDGASESRRMVVVR